MLHINKKYPEKFSTHEFRVNRSNSTSNTNSCLNTHSLQQGMRNTILRHHCQVVMVRFHDDMFAQNLQI